MISNRRGGWRNPSRLQAAELPSVPVGRGDVMWWDFCPILVGDFYPIHWMLKGDAADLASSQRPLPKALDVSEGLLIEDEILVPGRVATEVLILDLVLRTRLHVDVCWLWHVVAAISQC
jgi:hypothetical protein